MPPSQPLSRALRGWSAALVATLMASAAHGLASATPLVSTGSVVAFLLAGLISVALAGRRTSPLRLSVGVVLSQSAFHVLLHTLSHPVHALAVRAPADSGSTHAGHAVTQPSPASSPAGAMLSGHAAHGGSAAQPAVVAQSAEPGGSSLLDMVTGGSPWMAGAHALAAALTVLLLLNAERTVAALLSLLALAVPRIPALPRPLVLPEPVTLSWTWSPSPLTDLGLALTGLRHRGPPRVQTRARVLVAF